MDRDTFEFPELPDFLNRATNGIPVTGCPPERKPRGPRKSKVELRSVFLKGKRGLADGWHNAALVKMGNIWCRLLICGKTIVVPKEVWENAK